MHHLRTNFFPYEISTDRNWKRRIRYLIYYLLSWTGGRKIKVGKNGGKSSESVATTLIQKNVYT